jgi:hypothetical protein
MQRPLLQENAPVPHVTGAGIIILIKAAVNRYFREKLSGKRRIGNKTSSYVGSTPIYNICGTDFPTNIKVILTF